MKRKPLLLSAVTAAALAGAAAAATLCHVRWYPLAKFGPITVFETTTKEGERVRVLSQGGVYQSATYVSPARRFDLVFEYYRAFDHVFDDESPANPRRRMLMLGGGGYAYPKHVISRHPDVSVDVLEADPLVTRIARRHFFLDDLLKERCGESGPRLNLVSARAQDYLLGACGMDYDVVINDCFAGAAPSGGQEAVEVCEHARRALRPGGVYVLNVVDEEGAYGPTVERGVRTLAAVFPYVYVIPCPDSDFGGSDNVMLLACDRPCSLGGVEWAQMGAE
ncbi:MAG: fused MFS/spermidine synthase [Eggerthellales bacterium]|nr:fused MFS/spermidine synthase [Eggerthellales bacterium]